MLCRRVRIIAVYQQDLFDKRRKKRNRRITSTEAQEQQALFDWAQMNFARYPELRWLMHIPNGGGRNPREALALMRRGVKPGVADVFLPAIRGGFGGLWIELKTEKGRATDLQEEFLRDMTIAGYRAEICTGWESARAVIIDYIGN